MKKPIATARSIDPNRPPGAPLAPWTYTNPELFELEYKALFLNRWQFIGHENDVRRIGEYTTADIGRDSVIVIRGKDAQLRAFKNVCRHRASRILEGSGSCRAVIRCPYHGWTYQLDGSLMAIPQQENFPDLDKRRYGLHEIELDIFNGLLFARVSGTGPSVAEQFAHTAHFFEKFDVSNYEKLRDPVEQVWDANWKVAWDNYLENYHIPIGHPGLHRLLIEHDDYDDLTSGVSYGIFDIREKPSNVDEERRYQALFHYANQRLPDAVKGKWVQFGLMPNLGIDLYPEMLDMFQLVPLTPEKTLVRAWFYGHENPTPEEQELRRLNLAINDAVNDEDRTLCERVQKGLRTHGYMPGPLSKQETCIFNFHEKLRARLPVMSLPQQPDRGAVAATNMQMAKP